MMLKIKIGKNLIIKSRTFELNSAGRFDLVDG